MKADDGENPRAQLPAFASPEDELKAIYETKTKVPMPARVLRTIKENLELRCIPFAGYVAEIRNHAGGRWQNPAGLLITLSREFVQRTLPVDPPRPSTPLQGAAKALPCACGGGGYLRVNGEIQHCSCLMGQECARIDRRRITEAASAVSVST